MSHLVFVFGTLKEGFPNFPANRGVRVPGDFVTADRLPLFLVGERHSPWLINEPGRGRQVVGQVFRVDAAALQEMDALERIHEPDGYRRRPIKVMAAGVVGDAGHLVAAYLKHPEQLDDLSVRLGPLAELTLEHAAIYRKGDPGS